MTLTANSAKQHISSYPHFPAWFILLVNCIETVGETS